MNPVASPAGWSSKPCAELSRLRSGRPLSRQVKAGLQQVHLQLQDLSTRLYQQRTVGSTVVVLLAQGNRGACLWVGDSRVYLLREGGLTSVDA